jgi:type VI secretion system protein ImpC
MAEETVQAQGQAIVQDQKQASVLDQILNNYVFKSDRQQSLRELRELFDEIENETITVPTVPADLKKQIGARIADIDVVISRQLNAIMHHEDFQRLEAAWRGLHYLVQNTETSTMLKIRVLNVSKEDLLDDVALASEFDQSALFEKVYTQEFGQAGGDPFGVLIGDYAFGKHVQDMTLLEKIAEVAAAAHAPFIASASSDLLSLENFTDLNRPRDLALRFEGAEHIKWREFRNKEDSRYVGLTLPHFLLRLPYGPDTVPVKTFQFQEDVDGKEHNKYLWGNAAYALATRLTDAFAKHSWCVAIRGLEGGGLVEGLPAHTFRTDSGDIELKCPTEVAIPDRREKELSDLGFIPLVHQKGSSQAVFYGAQSCQRAQKYDTDEANANARLSTQLQYMFAVARFAHYLKVICRDKIGSFATRQNCEDYLNRWIANYVLLDDNAGQNLKAKKPLREARVDVKDVPGKPGVYKAEVFLKPHFQLDEITLNLHLVAELPAPTR